MIKNKYVKYIVFAILICLAAICYIFTKSDNQIGLLGVFIGGTFTILGVLLALFYSQIEQELEIESHKKMLLTQLEFTHDFIADLPSKGSSSIFGGLLIYDHDWHKHTQYINIDKNDFRTVVDWFYVMYLIEKEANINSDGSIAADYILKKFNPEKEMFNIENVIKKLI
jgi:hypothetical protein